MNKQIRQNLTRDEFEKIWYHYDQVGSFDFVFVDAKRKGKEKMSCKITMFDLVKN